MQRFIFFALLPTVLSSSILQRQILSVSNDFLITSIGIGQPAQNFDLALELDESKLVVLDKTSIDYTIDYQYDYIKMLYDPIDSNTAKVSNYACRHQYLNGKNATGIYADDVLTLGNNTFKDKSIRFCDINTPRNANKISQDPLQWLMKLQVDGFVGLAQGSVNVFENLGFQQLTIALDRNSNNDENVGQLTLGGEDPNCKDFQKFPSYDANLWRILSKNLTYSSATNMGSFAIKINPHSDQLVVPQVIYNAILRSFGGRYYSSCDKYKNQPPLQFEIYGKTYSLPVMDYFRPSQTDSSTCYLHVDQSATGEIEFGRTFLKRYCLFMDYKTMTIGVGSAA